MTVLELMEELENFRDDTEVRVQIAGRSSPACVTFNAVEDVVYIVPEEEDMG
jgi:hypothetical protein